MFPNALDLWLISIYTELDIRGSFEGARNIMLQAIRRNENDPVYYLEYLKFELRFL